MDAISVAWSPRGKSVRPIEPWKSTSPRSRAAGAWKNTTWPGVCPGCGSHFSVAAPKHTVSAVSSQRSGVKAAVAEPEHAALVGQLLDQNRSSICGPSSGTPCLRALLAGLPRSDRCVVGQEDLLELSAGLGQHLVDAVQVAAGSNTAARLVSSHTGSSSSVRRG